LFVEEKREEDTMIDIFQEETHHQGEFIALLWQMEIEPPHMGWGKYINMWSSV